MNDNPLNRKLAHRKAEAALIETEIILACENAARRACHGRRLPIDRSQWSETAWNRYLAEATRMQQLYGARLRRIRRAIDKLDRPAALPLRS